jgi:manganese/zinc/iron transport system permease protein
MGDSLSHAALPGVAVAFLVAGRDLSVLLIGAGVAGWLGMLLISSVIHTTRIKQDTAMGVTLATFFAIGLALLTYIQGRPDASQAGLDRFIFGQAAAMVRSDVELITGVGLVEFAVLFLFWKEFKLITFSSATSSASPVATRCSSTTASWSPTAPAAPRRRSPSPSWAPPSTCR